jgi:hypothetical protein
MRLSADIDKLVSAENVKRNQLNDKIQEQLN